MSNQAQTPSPQLDGVADILSRLETAVLSKRPPAAPEHGHNGNLRAYECGVEGCDRNAYASGLCNAHYIRRRTGADMSAPIRRVRKASASCETCGERITDKGAWGLCKKHYRRARAATIKQALVEAFGGLCADCGSSFHYAAFDFHHVTEKDAAISAMAQASSLDAIAAEAAKCELLCANCHRVRHATSEVLEP